ncbi:MAG TPA: C4-type zinc ribbon domain-containing protein [Tepidisphaeraceae bacterium]|nr:C4-type zinc ribbon domain-containing protein [Tepidisphaeraceae bacterium]
MGPTVSALVNLFNADQTLREAQTRLDVASKNVRIQERRVHDLEARQKAGQALVKSLHAKSMAVDADVQGRDARIEKLRTQQASAKNNKEYQAFLVEINTGKVDREKAEEEGLKIVAQIEAQQKELEAVATQLQAEQAKLAEMKGSISQTLADLQAEIDRVQPTRDAAAGEVGKLSAKSLNVYERLAERYDGEAIAPIGQPDRRQEAYSCMACHLELVTDIYNKLKTRDELVFCPNCGRILYAPAEMIYEQAKPKSPSQRAAPTKKRVVSSEPSRAMDPVKAELDRLLRRAQGESVKNSNAAGSNPVEFEVYIQGKYFGNYKGQNIDNFRRTARYCLHESGVIKDMDVYEKGQGPKSLAAAAEKAAADAVSTEATAASPSAPTAPSQPVEAPAAAAAPTRPAEQPLASGANEVNPASQPNESVPSESAPGESAPVIEADASMDGAEKDEALSR